MKVHDVTDALSFSYSHDLKATLLLISSVTNLGLVHVAAGMLIYNFIKMK